MGYLLTVARTVSLWDSGEFIASIHILGIPHPPGAPFYMILGKSWELATFFLPHIAYRINLLSAVFSVLACLLMFEVALVVAARIRLAARLRIPCAVMAAMLLAFSNTFWFNGGETEVYAFSVMNLLLGFWVLCKWDGEGGRFPSRWIVLFVYVSFLGVGVHLYSMLWFPVLWLMIGLRSGRRVFSDFPFWIIGMVFGSVIAFSKPFLFGSVLMWLLCCGLGVILCRKKRGPALLLLLSAGPCLWLFKVMEIPGNLFSGAGSWLYWVVLLLTVLAGVALYRGARPGRTRSKDLMFYGSLVLAALIGYSTYAYVPIRSQLNPRIDEDNPETWPRLHAFIERKQYGSENMLERMFHRRGKWTSQFGMGHTGFLGYQASQFWPVRAGGGRPGAALLAAIGMVLLVLWVLIENFQRNRGWLGLVLALYGISSAGLVVYMNFSDGTRVEVYYLKHWAKQVDKVRQKLSAAGELPPGGLNPNTLNDYESLLGKNPADTAKFWNVFKKKEYERWSLLKKMAASHGFALPGLPRPARAEVRNRDYFYTPAFALFCLMLSLSIFLLLEALMGRFPRRAAWLVAAGMLLAAVSWVLPYAAFWKTHDRRHDFFASDFAYNLLQSCPPRAILFTNGDNDTFPLWYLQYVEKIRTDVSVINFSLANTDWYGEQLTRHDPAVRLPTLERGGSYSVPRWVRAADSLRVGVLSDSSLEFVLGGPPGFVLRPQDQLFMEAVHYNHPRRPICVTLSTENASVLGLHNQLEIRGLVKVLTGKSGIDLKALDQNLFEVFRFRHLGGQMNNPVAKNLSRNYQHLIYQGTLAHGEVLEKAIGEKDTASADSAREWLKKYEILSQKVLGAL